MKRLHLCCFCASSALFVLNGAALSSAAVFERDWKTPGDGLLTFDDVHQREWLDLSVSRLDQFPEPRLESAIDEIGPGGLFEGFTFAKSNDAIAFAQSAGIDTTTLNFAVNDTPTSNLIPLIRSIPDGVAILRAIGFIDEMDPRSPLPSKHLGTVFLRSEGGFAGMFVTYVDDYLHNPSNGLMLFRVVPETSTALLAFFAALLLAYRARTF